MKSITDEKLQSLVEAALFIAGKPMTVQSLKQELLLDYQVTNKRIKQVLEQLTQDYQGRGIALLKVASGYRFQAIAEHSEDLSALFKEKSPRYSRALLETLALIAYKQPITRGEIEEIRGVAVSSHIIKTLTERNWVKTVGHKEVPGRPALYATTNAFLDYFSLTSLAQLPELMPISALSLGDHDTMPAQVSENR
ncbi:SMC-Scp complex subunit ScpB [Thalassomonas actiniarum]|uniref:SMC-Scp complex subunit ScpB n=1 Tax=Thalassomonas actiniarum TaxID=485447 RepID=A0AAF0C1U4_9GAMM|nr:SMC-Scp complex subunit ScpB [Thalassomonas actiniarum]WDD97120.1 SMC-Scp complex subunit ScpB [Thalassomonas actiniarum]